MTPLELKTLRKQYKLTQEQFAIAIGVKRLTVINWEKSRFQIPMDIEERLAQANLLVPTQKPAKSKPYHTDFYGLYVLRREQLNEDHAEAWHVCCTDCKLYDRPLPTQEDIAAIIERYPDIINGESK